MAAVIRCDRCPAIDQSMTQVLGFDLCTDCVAALQVWIKTSVRAKPESARLRNIPPKGHMLKVARMLIARDGFVTEETFASVTGLRGREPYYRLAYLRRRGEIESDTRVDGSVFFVLAQPERSAAE